MFEMADLVIGEELYRKSLVEEFLGTTNTARDEL